MAISREEYKELEEVVSDANISDDPALLDSYAFQWLAEVVRPGQSHFMPRPVAVLMPGSTAEIQAIVRICNRYRTRVKPYSTGWYFYGAPQKDGDNTVQLDLRRMGRILEIDEKNMFTVIEPYVICANLQAELMKRGLNLNIIGAGASTSPLASATSYSGPGPSSFWMGHNSEVLLGMEWVTPTGEVIKTGSLGSGAGWFCGEGPGPSLRGICRGARGARGGMGVYTKCALKLTHWPGPSQMPIEGTVPAYRSPIPENFRTYTLAFPSWEALAEAYYKIYDNEIGYLFHKQFNMLGADLAPAFWLLYNDPSKTLSDIEEIARRPEVKELIEEMRCAFQIVMAGRSLRDIEFQDKVLERILADTGGWKVARMCEPDMTEFTYLYLTRLGHKHLNYVYVGGYLGTWMQSGPPDFVIQYRPVAEAGLYRDSESGLLVQCGGDSMMGSGSATGGGGNTGFEQFVSYDPANEESISAVIEHMHNATRDAVQHGFAPGHETPFLQIGMTDEQLHDQFARSSQPLIYHLQREIKQLLDPNDVGDRLYSWLPGPEQNP
ncbi:MAG: FAD-binding oxidoreductase [Dehalococcoidales bacterium]|nr:FAD-binding oxidoreductase [Dehalococcoidales bacterium]